MVIDAWEHAYWKDVGAHVDTATRLDLHPAGAV
jgi:hypothetical protein